MLQSRGLLQYQRSFPMEDSSLDIPNEVQDSMCDWLKSERTCLRANLSKHHRIKKPPALKLRRHKPKSGRGLLSTETTQKENPLKVDVQDPREELPLPMPLQENGSCQSAARASPDDPPLSKQQIQIQYKHTKATPQVQITAGDVGEYIGDIRAYFTSRQKPTVDLRVYNALQAQVPVSSRNTLVTWMVTVMEGAKVSPDCTFLAVEIFDRVLMAKAIPEQQVYVVCVSCMLIAWKYEEVAYPPLGYFVQLAGTGITGKDIKEMEGSILVLLGFELTHISPLYYVALMNGLEGKAKSLACGILQVSLLDLRFKEFCPQMLSECSAILSTSKLQGSLQVQGVCEEECVCIQLLQCFVERYEKESPNRLWRMVENKYLDYFVIKE